MPGAVETAPAPSTPLRASTRVLSSPPVAPAPSAVAQAPASMADVPFGTLSVTVAGCKGLNPALADACTRAVVRLRIGDAVHVTGVASESGGTARPRYGDTFPIPIRADRDLTLDVVEPAAGNADHAAGKVVATTRVSVMPWVSRGGFTGDLELRDAMLRPCGLVSLVCTYASAPPPPRAAGGGAAESAVVVADAATAAAEAGIPHTAHLAPQPPSREIYATATFAATVPGAPRDVQAPFTEAEVREAFAALDLDSNGFIGAAELRSVLAAMGEPVTDAEIDEMVRMVDRDGDGQVSFPEFHRLLMGADAPPPAVGHVARGAVPPVGGSGAGVPPASAAPRASVEAAAADVADVIQARASRKTAMEAAVGSASLTMDRLKSAWAQFQARDRARTGKADFATTCELLAVDATAAMESAFRAYAPGPDGAIPFLLLVLGAAGYVAAAREDRQRFVFGALDADHDGQINKVWPPWRGGGGAGCASLLRPAHGA
jgi:hypothetical protein